MCRSEESKVEHITNAINRLGCQSSTTNYLVALPSLPQLRPTVPVVATYNENVVMFREIGDFYSFSKISTAMHRLILSILSANGSCSQYKNALYLSPWDK